MRRSACLSISILLATAWAYGNNIKCTVNGTVLDTTKVSELVICKYDEDPKNAQIRPSIIDGKFTCDISSTEIENYKLIDFGAVLKQGHTPLWGEFLIEDGAVVDIVVDGEKVSVTSTGTEQNKVEKMKQMEYEVFAPQFDEIDTLPDSIKSAALEKLDNEYTQWQLDYYANDPSISFLFKLCEKLSMFHFTDKTVKPMLDIYNTGNMSAVYPGHSLHKKISSLADTGLQMIGSQYNDYTAFDLEENIVKASDFMKSGSPTVIVIWATWCAPCRREALDMISVYEKYAAKGVNFLGLAREFKSTDAIKSVVEKDNHPWPTILDLDDKYQIFKYHGTSSSGLYLIDGNGKIIATGYDFNEIKPDLDKLL